MVFPNIFTKFEIPLFNWALSGCSQVLLIVPPNLTAQFFLVSEIRCLYDFFSKVFNELKLIYKYLTNTEILIL